MPISAVKQKYSTLSENIFKPGISRFFGSTVWKPLLNMPWFDGSKLEQSIRDAVDEVERRQGGDDVKLMAPTPGPDGSEAEAEAKCQM
jgi:hypothetical protein